jgi:hypothetical protein
MQVVSRGTAALDRKSRAELSVVFHVEHIFLALIFLEFTLSLGPATATAAASIGMESYSAIFQFHDLCRGGLRSGIEANRDQRESKDRPAVFHVEHLLELPYRKRFTWNIARTTARLKLAKLPWSLERHGSEVLSGTD